MFGCQFFADGFAHFPLFGEPARFLLGKYCFTINVYIENTAVRRHDFNLLNFAVPKTEDLFRHPGGSRQVPS